MIVYLWVMVVVLVLCTLGNGWYLYQGYRPPCESRFILAIDLVFTVVGAAWAGWLLLA